MKTSTVSDGFADLQVRLEDTRRSIGVQVQDLSTSVPAVAGVVPARSPRSRTVASEGRLPVGDLILLGTAWIGLLALVALAL